MYANDLVICSESEENLKVMIRRRFVELYKRRGLKLMVLRGEEGLICEDQER